MLSVVKSYLQVKLNLSERGAEMVEYAIVLACIAAVGVVVYSTKTDTQGATSSLFGVLNGLWSKISSTANSI